MKGENDGICEVDVGDGGEDGGEELGFGVGGGGDGEG